MFIIYFYILLMVFSLFVIIIAALAETSIQSFSKAKLFILYKHHNNFQYVKNFKENITDTIFSVLTVGYIFHSIFSTIFTILAHNYLNMPMMYISCILAALLIICEMSVKKIGIVFPEKSVLFVGYYCFLIKVVFGKIAIFFNCIISVIMKYILSYQEDPNKEDNELISIIELKMEEDKISGRMMKNILQIKNTYVEDIMTKRNDILYIEFHKSLQEIRKEIYDMIENNNIKTYLPIWHNEKNNFIGVINTKQFFIDLHQKNINFHDVIEDMFFIPAGSNVYKILETFQKNRKHFAFVLNEYGDIIGLVTLHDILEEVVGSDLFNTNDNEKQHVLINDNEFLVVDGDMSVKELYKYFPNDFFSNQIYNINDLIINKIKRIPDEGEEFLYENILFTILEKEKNTITKVLLSIKNIVNTNN